MNQGRMNPTSKSRPTPSTAEEQPGPSSPGRSQNEGAPPSLESNKRCQSETIEHLTILIQRLVALIYAIAFASWVFQLRTLYGMEGLLPIKTYLPHMQTTNFILKSFRHLLSYFYDPVEPIELICLLGWGLSLLIAFHNRLRNSYSFATLWLCYYCLYSVGQDFSQFQWDILMLEVGFIIIILCHFEVAGRELLRFLAFKLYFSSGLLKLLSKCPTWWDLTALHHHFASQCIPHTLSWWAHQLPGALKKFLVAGNYYILVFGALFLYFPLRSLRIYGFLLQLIMQISIMMTGNYNFFNLLSITITLSVLDDQFISRYFPNWLRQMAGIKKPIPQEDWRMKRYLEIGLCLYSTGVSMFNLFPPEVILQNKKLPFTVEDIGKTILSEQAVHYFLVYVSFFFFFYLCYFGIQKSYTPGQKLRKAGKTLISILVFLSCFHVSAMVFQRGFQIWNYTTVVIPHEQVNTLHDYTADYHIFSSYGLFRRMTGVNGRPELIFEGSADGKNWLEFEFYYKPGKTDKLSLPVIPHQPRLEWQLWFAAFAKGPQDLYLINLMYKLLTEKEMGNFLKNSPFQERPPKFIRIMKYQYNYTSIEEMASSGNFWKRRQSELYYGPTSLQDEQLMGIARQYSFDVIKEKRKGSTIEQAMRALSWSLLLLTIYELFMCLLW